LGSVRVSGHEGVCGRGGGAGRVLVVVVVVAAAAAVVVKVVVKVVVVVVVVVVGASRDAPTTITATTTNCTICGRVARPPQMYGGVWRCMRSVWVCRGLGVCGDVGVWGRGVVCVVWGGVGAW